MELEGWFNKEMEVATEQEAFARLLALPPDSPYWKNRWMFTKPVFLNESMQGNDPARFGRWLRLQPKALTNHIYAAPSNALGQEPCAAVCARSPAPEGYTSGTTEKE